MSYDWTTYQSYLATMMATTTSDQYFQTILPMCVDYAEQRIYRELDLLNTRMRDSSTSCTAGTRMVTLTNTLVVAETLAAITPAGTAPAVGARHVLIPCTHDFIDETYPNDSPSAYQALPQYFAMLDQQTAMLGPCPDGAYVLEVTGTYRPAPLSADNTTTPLTVLLPDLFMAASMCFMAAYQKNFGAQADDPKMAASWEAQYQSLLTAARSEEFRKKFEASSWTPMIPSTEVNKQRG